MKMDIPTPIYWAARNGHTEIVEVLAPLTGQAILMLQLKNGQTPI